MCSMKHQISHDLPRPRVGFVESRHSKSHLTDCMLNPHLDHLPRALMEQAMNRIIHIFVVATLLVLQQNAHVHKATGGSLVVVRAAQQQRTRKMVRREAGKYRQEQPCCRIDAIRILNQQERLPKSIVDLVFCLTLAKTSGLVVFEVLLQWTIAIISRSSDLSDHAQRKRKTAKHLRQLYAGLYLFI
eukprot:scaffold391_cov223-Pinguiococcus_pyrenoidosus.AAC.8